MLVNSPASEPAPTPSKNRPTSNLHLRTYSRRTLLLRVGQLNGAEPFPPPPRNQLTGPRSPKIPDPVGLAARSNEVSAPAEREHGDRDASNLPAPPSPHLEHVQPGDADPNAGEPTDHRLDDTPIDPSRPQVPLASHHPRKVAALDRFRIAASTLTRLRPRSSVDRAAVS
jgi:hypothetical protein